MDINEVVTQTATADVNKSSEIQMTTVFSRSRSGLTINVQLSPVVEEFIRNMGSGEQLDVRTIGRHWVPAKAGSPLLVYQVAPSQGDPSFTIDRVGMPIVEGVADTDLDGRTYVGKPSRMVNLAFFRLVGASEAGGVSFSIKGVYTRDAVNDMRDRVAQATKAFYFAYMKPMNASLQVITQDF